MFYSNSKMYEHYPKNRHFLIKAKTKKTIASKTFHVVMFSLDYNYLLLVFRVDGSMPFPNILFPTVYIIIKLRIKGCNVQTYSL